MTATQIFLKVCISYFLFNAADDLNAHLAVTQRLMGVRSADKTAMFSRRGEPMQLGDLA